jgi:small subunit ribosomal protein S1
MTETLSNVEAQPQDLAATLQQWVETPPPSLSAALAERGWSAETLEEYVRSGISTEDAETIRKVLVQGATSDQAEDAAVLARLSPLLDPRERAWDRILRSKSSGEVLTAPVTEATKGGVVVDVGVRGFVPASQLGLNVPRNLGQYVGRTLKLVVMEVDRGRRTVILSNRKVEEAARSEKRKSGLARIQEGEVRTGTVRRLTDIGAFVDVGGIDGLLHVSEISWRRVEKPSDVLQVNQKVEVKVLKVDPNTERISLSIRRLTPDPWEAARKNYQVGSTAKVTVSRTVPQGAVVELPEGIEGFIPISELASRRISTPEEAVQVGQELEALVIDLLPRDRRIVFSIRKLEQKRERTVIDTYQKKARTSSTSERTTLGDLFGHLFAELKQEHPEEPASPEPSDAETPGAENAQTAAASPDEAAIEHAAVVDESGNVDPEVAVPGWEAPVAEHEAPDADGAVSLALGAEEAPAAAPEEPDVSPVISPNGTHAEAEMATHHAPALTGDETTIPEAGVGSEEHA